MTAPPTTTGAFAARAATLDDYERFTRFFAMFEMPDPTPPPTWWARFHANAVFLEDERGDAIAYGQAYRLGEEGYVLHVAVEPRARDRGVGRTLMRELAARLRDAGCTRWGLYVKEENASAIALYERCGMHVDARVELLEVPWTAIAALGRSDVDVEPFAHEDDPAVEAALGFPRGRFARFREMPERALFRAMRGDAIVGMLAFDPAVPSAPIVRAASPGVLGMLLTAARALATAGQLSTSVSTSVSMRFSMRVSIESAPELVSALVGAGAKRLLSLLHMSGPLPAA